MDIAGVGALLTGVAAVIGSLTALRRVRKSERTECDKRVREVQAAMREGIRIGHVHGGKS